MQPPFKRDFPFKAPIHHLLISLFHHEMMFTLTKDNQRLCHVTTLTDPCQQELQSPLTARSKKNLNAALLEDLSLIPSIHKGGSQPAPGRIRVLWPLWALTRKCVQANTDTHTQVIKNTSFKIIIIIVPHQA